MCTNEKITIALASKFHDERFLDEDFRSPEGKREFNGTGK